MPEWHGFSPFERDGDCKRPRLRAVADYGGTDDDPVPMLLLLQERDMVELTEAELRWLVDEVAPVALKRMGERP